MALLFFPTADCGIFHLFYAFECQLAYQRPTDSPNHEKRKRPGQEEVRILNKVKQANYKKTSIYKGHSLSYLVTP